MNTWHITSRLPSDEPNAANFAAYSQPQLIAGASPDARYLLMPCTTTTLNALF